MGCVSTDRHTRTYIQTWHYCYDPWWVHYRLGLTWITRLLMHIEWVATGTHYGIRLNHLESTHLSSVISATHSVWHVYHCVGFCIFS